MSSYDFSTLSPSDFELLVRDLLAAEYGWQLEAFGHGPDGGIDLRGTLSSGKVIVQCKHYAGSRFSDLRRAARQERIKVEAEEPSLYLFVTSQDLSRTQKDTLRDELAPWLSSPHNALCRTDLNALLDKHPQVEQQNFKLWLASIGVIERIAQSGMWERSEALMERVSDRVRMYVTNRGFTRAKAQLDATGVLVLTGPPGVGKSMLAEMLLLGHWQDGWQVVVVSSDIDEAWDMYRRDRKQIFYYDDFLGQTDISERNKNEESRIVRFMESVARKDGKRLVMTSRAQILRQAEIQSEPIARAGFSVSESVVRLSDYGPLERARILYNHLYFSDLPRDTIREYVSSRDYFQVVQHANFTPRIVEQVLKQPIIDAQNLSASLNNALDRPIELWGTMFHSVLSSLAKRIVMSLLMFPLEGVEPAELQSELGAIGMEAISYKHALRALEGTWIRIAEVRSPVRRVIRFADPSCRDFIIALVDSEPGLTDELIQSATSLQQVERLISYASARLGGNLRCPGLAQHFASNHAFVIAQLNRLTNLEVEEAKRAERLREYEFNQNVIVPLADILDVSRTLDSGLWKAVLDLTVDTMRDFVDMSYFESRALKVIASNLMSPLQGSIDTDSIEIVLSGWADAHLVGDDLTYLADFLAAWSSDLEDVGVSVEFLGDAFIAGAKAELGDITANANEPDDADAWVDELEDTARKIGLEPSLSDNFRSTRDDIAEWASEFGTNNKVRRSASISPEGSDSVRTTPTASERRTIDHLFSHLE